MTGRVNLRSIPKELAGVAVSREKLEYIKRRVRESLPDRPLERPLSDLLAHAYMVGVVDAVRGLFPADGKTSAENRKDFSDREPCANETGAEAQQ